MHVSPHHGKISSKFLIDYDDMLLGWRMMFSVMTCSGDIYEAQVWSDEESVRIKCSVRLRNSTHHVQQQQQTVPVREYRHGSSPAQVHRVQRPSRESYQQ